MLRLSPVAARIVFKCACITLFGFILSSCQGGAGGIASMTMSEIGNAAGGGTANTVASAGNASSVNHSEITSKALVPVTLNYKLAGSTLTNNLRDTSAFNRHLQYISGSNTRITIVVTTEDGSPTTYGPTACTTTICTINFTTIPGVNAIEFTLTDNSNNILSNFRIRKLIQPVTLNTLNFTANPVVRSVAVQLASGTVNAGTATNDVLTVIAKDADGNTLVGNTSFVDQAGNPVEIFLAVANNQAGGRGTVKILGQSVVSGPGQSSPTARYDGNWLANSVISLTTSSNLITNLTSATLTTVPVLKQFSVGTNPDGIVTGIDGNVWFTEHGSNKIGKLTPSGTLTEYTIPSGGSSPSEAMAVGADGNMWFAENSGNKIAKVTVNGVFTEYSVPTGGSGPFGIASGPDGALWFTENAANKIGRVTTSGTFSEYSMAAGSGPTSIILAPDNNLWFTESSGNKVGKITTSGVITEYTPPSGGSKPTSITVGPDGRLWITENGANKIAVLTTSGAFTEYSSSTVGSAPYGIAVGPDGNLWFTTSNNNLGYSDNSGNVTLVVGASSKPQYLTIGSDGNLWMTEYGGNQIGELIY
jgi:streptogramin lyase